MAIFTSVKLKLCYYTGKSNQPNIICYFTHILELQNLLFWKIVLEILLYQTDSIWLFLIDLFTCFLSYYLSTLSSSILMLPWYVDTLMNHCKYIQLPGNIGLIVFNINDKWHLFKSLCTFRNQFFTYFTFLLGLIIK